MMIEERIASRILNQEIDAISKHLKGIHETMRENHAREDLLIDNELSPLLGESGIEVRLRYDDRNRAWSLYSGVIAPNEPWRNWVGYGFLSYGNSVDLGELAYELVENCIANAVEEYEREYC